MIWAPRAATASSISAQSRAIFEAAAVVDLHLAVASFPAELLRQRWPDVIWDEERVFCLRSCLMKPEHLDWVEQIWQILMQVADEVGV